MIRKLRNSSRGVLLWFFLMSAIITVQAQVRTVSGTVKDADTRETLIGVNITAAHDRSLGTVTDIDGKYQITLPDTVSALSFSYVGYTTQIIPITSNLLNVEMSAGQQLSEVVVVGYGTQKTREVTSAVSSVKSEDFNRGNISDPIQLIQGKVAGLSIAKPGSDPNADFNIRLRGLSTFGSNTEPLVIIDGIQGGNLKSIDPQDIVSIDVLKDASAAAIYGTRAASGVILITTKKGEYVPGGKPFNVEFSASLTGENVANTVSVLTPEDYAGLADVAPITDFGQKTDWFDEITRTAMSQAYNLAINGADENSNYRVAVNYRDVEGVVLGTGFTQLNGRLNFTQKALNDHLTIDLNLSTTLRNETYAPSEAMRYAVRYNPTAPVTDTDAYSQEWGGYFQRNAFYFFNPKAIIEQNTLDGKKYNIQGGLKGTYEIIKGLKASIFYSVTMNNDLYGTYWSKNSLWNPYEVGSHKGFAKKETKDYFNELFELTGSYEKTIKEITFSVLGGYSWQEATADNFWAYGEGFLTDDFSYNSLGSASGEIANKEAMYSHKEKTTLIGFFARGTFNYSNGVFLTLNFRHDGSSMFGENNKWGNFPGISAGVDIARFAKIPYVDRLKVRGGFGITGNLPPNPYLSQLLYNSTSSNFFYNGGYIQAYEPTRNNNPDLKWETKQDIGVGLDYALFDYRLSGSIDYYHSLSSDLIMEAVVAQPPNLSDRTWLNVGELQNSGIEFAIGYSMLPGSKFLWTTDFNFTKFFETKLNKITSPLTGTESIQYLGDLGDPFLTGKKSILMEEGAAVGQIIAPIYLETDTAGTMQFKDVNGDGTFDSKLDYEVVGNGLPKFQLGWANNFSYQGFYLNFFLRGVFGHSLVNVNNAKFGVPVVLGIQSGTDQVLDFRTAENGPEYSDVHVEKANFVRLDNWSFGYNFRIKENKYIQSIQLYLSGQNLFTITNYSGVDPEVRYVDSADNDNPLAPGIDRQNTYFSTRTFTLGVNVTF
jgi:TonB-dependent starch-binding outer membrane protein SusC